MSGGHKITEYLASLIIVLVLLLIVALAEHGTATQSLHHDHRDSDTPSSVYHSLASFLGNSSLLLPSTSTAAISDHLLALSFRTCEYGTLLEQLSNDSWQLELLADGSLRLTVRTADTAHHQVAAGTAVEPPLVVTSQASALNDNRWHTVALIFRPSSQEVLLQVDRRPHVLVAAAKPQPLHERALQALRRRGSRLVGRNFRGCLVGGPGVWLSEPGAVRNSVVDGSCLLPDTETCDGYNDGALSPCFAQPCQNGAKCSETIAGTSYRCNCSARYGGQNCHIDQGPLCSYPENRCANGGECQEDRWGTHTVCLCRPPWTGRRCESRQLAACVVDPCLNGGVCSTSRSGQPVCTCPAGFTGVHCATQVDNCAIAPCLHQAECINTNNSFVCDCRATGYTGELCELNVDECENRPCLNNATCHDLFGTYMCACTVGWEGRNCDQDVDECVSSPCLNGGSCLNRAGSFQCQCVDGFAGPTCQQAVASSAATVLAGGEGQACGARLCPANSQCVFDSLQEPICQCTPGYSGPTCSVSDSTTVSISDRVDDLERSKSDSSASPIPSSSPPVNDDANALHQLHSLLDDINRSHHNRHSAGDEPVPAAANAGDEHTGRLASALLRYAGFSCASAPCRHGATCRPVVSTPDRAADGFQCLCAPGFVGVTCETRDACVHEEDDGGRGGGWCGQHGSCSLSADSHEPVCSCQPGYSGERCEVDVCAQRPCHNGGRCEVSSSKPGYYCECPLGFEGLHCESGGDCRSVGCPSGQYCGSEPGEPHSCQQCPPSGCPPSVSTADTPTPSRANIVALPPSEFDLVARNLQATRCHHNLCVQNATCVPSSANDNGYECVCPSGYAGELCNTKADACERHDPCVNGICKSGVGDSYQCYCRPGFLGDHCDFDYDECLPRPCHNNATCVNLVNSYECRCLPGYQGTNCQVDIDECAASPCRNNATCEDKVADYHCVCQPGFDGKNCQNNIDECQPKPCLNNGTCVDHVNGFTCTCDDTGFYGATCHLNIDDCVSATCQHGGTCVDLVKDYKCNCYVGFEGKNCQLDVKECELLPCENGGTCLERSDRSLYRQDHSLALSSMAAVAAAAGSDVILLDGLTPSLPGHYSDATAGGFVCLCVAGFTGATCQQNIDDCAARPCGNGTCVDGVNSFTCQCLPGYEGRLCEREIDECARYAPCVHGQCVDLVADYRCTCSEGYGGKNCSVRLSGCDSVRCLNEGQCEPFVVEETQHNFTCRCRAGFAGRLCGDVTTFSLTEDTHVRLDVSPERHSAADAFAADYSISLSFRTTLTDVLLAAAGGGPDSVFVRLRLSNGSVNAFCSLMNDADGVTLGDGRVSDAAWHSVRLLLNGSRAWLSVDATTTDPVPLRVSSPQQLRLPFTVLGSPHADSGSALRGFVAAVPPFVGCMRDVRVGGETVVPRRLSSGQSAGVVEGCSRVDQCEPTPCHNDGTCDDLWRTFTCSCRRPFLGATCQQHVPAATFGHENVTQGASAARVQLAPKFAASLRNFFDLSLFVRTRQPSGLVFYLGSAVETGLSSSPAAAAAVLQQRRQQLRRFVQAELRAGQLSVHVQLAAGQLQLISVPGPRLDDGVNNLVRMVLNGTRLSVFVNGERQVSGLVSVNSASSLSLQVLYLGNIGATSAANDGDAARGSRRTDALSDGTARQRRQLSASRAANAVVPFKGSIQDVRITNADGETRTVEFFPLNDSSLALPESLGALVMVGLLAGSVSDDSCRARPCSNNATCSVTWNDFSCECPRGYRGRTCEALQHCEWHQCPAGFTCGELSDGHECVGNATFNGVNSTAVYRLVVSTGDQSTSTVPIAGNDSVETTSALDSVSVRFRSRVGGVLFSANDGVEQLVLAVTVDAGVLLRWPDGNLRWPDAAGTLLSGEWRTLRLRHNASHAWTLIDGRPMRALPLPAPIQLDSLVRRGQVRLGANDGPAMVSPAHFRGCLSEARVGRLLLPFVTDDQLQSTASRRFSVVGAGALPAVSLNCTLCYQHECENGGSCRDAANSFSCVCPAGFNGTVCQHNIDECQPSNLCANGARCVDAVASYTCECAAGYEGSYCRTDRDDCVDSPCVNGGRCVDMVNNYTCRCSDEYTGRNCERLRIVNCTHEPCRHAAVCVNSYNASGLAVNYTCQCAFGYAGRNCENVVDFCLDQPCENGATCTSLEAQGYECACVAGYAGTNCRENVDDCEPVPCQNAGRCVDLVNNFRCQCAPGWQGELCDEDVAECVQQPCLNNASCLELPGSYECTCPPSHCGRHCRLHNHCLTQVDLCKNGARCEPVCGGDEAVYSVANVSCQCVDQYFGPTCEDWSRVSEIVLVVVPLLCILLLAAVAGLVAFTMMAKQKRATRGTYSPSRQEMFNPRVELGNMKKPPPEERLI